jgi:hypothetical protein
MFRKTCLEYLSSLTATECLAVTGEGPGLSPRGKKLLVWLQRRYSGRVKVVLDLDEQQVLQVSYR